MKGCSIGTKSHHKWARQGKRRRTGPFSESPRTLTTPRLGSEHVVTRRRLRQLKELCVPLRSPSTRAIVPKSIENARARLSITVQTKPGKPTQAGTSVELSLLKPLGERLWKTPHTNHRTS